MKKIFYGKAVYDQKEINAVTSTLKNTTQMGKNVKIFENKISKLFYKKYGLMVNSGSSALLLAFEIIKKFYADNKKFEVITPSLNFATTVSSIIKVGLKPKFVDVELLTLCADDKLIEKSITKNTVAICVPNLIGNLPNWIALRRIAKKYKLILIEDSADTLGAKFKNKSSGYYSDISICSFYGSHVISCGGNGGIVCMNNKNFFEYATLLRSWGRDSSLFSDSEKIENRFNLKLDGIDYDRKFVFSQLGYNLEPSEIGASFGIVQLSRLKQNIKRRDLNFKRHYNFFKKYNDFFEVPKVYPNADTSWLAYPIIIKQNKFFNRKKLMIFLEKNNIQTRVIFTGNILRQPGFNRVTNQNKNIFKNSDNIMKNGILIGLHHGMSFDEVDYIHKIINKFLNLNINS